MENYIFENRFQFFKKSGPRIFEVGPRVLSNTLYLQTGGGVKKWNDGPKYLQLSKVTI